MKTKSDCPGRSEEQHISNLLRCAKRARGSVNQQAGGRPQTRTVAGRVSPSRLAPYLLYHPCGRNGQYVNQNRNNETRLLQVHAAKQKDKK